MKISPPLKLLACLLAISSAGAQQEILPQLDKKGEPMDPGYMQGVNISHYLSQLGSSFTYGDPQYVSKKDFVWLKKQGYDHIRLPVDGDLLLNKDGTIRTGRFKEIDRAIAWAHDAGLNVLLDMHHLPGSSFSTNPDSRLFENEELQALAKSLWQFTAAHYKDKGDELRFEILNEPVSDDSDLVTRFYAKMIKVIRAISPDRVIVVCSNRWGRLETLDALIPLLPDDNLVVSIHYYDPHIFTHQKASWVQSDHPDFPSIEFPGTVPDLSDVIPDDHYGHGYSGAELTIDYIINEFQLLADWSAKHDVRVYNGEFGAYYKAPDQSRINWYTAVMNQCRQHGIGWAAWDYQGGFGIVDDETGRPTLVHRTLKPYLD